MSFVDGGPQPPPPPLGSVKLSHSWPSASMYARHVQGPESNWPAAMQYLLFPPSCPGSTSSQVDVSGDSAMDGVSTGAIFCRPARPSAISSAAYATPERRTR